MALLAHAARELDADAAIHAAQTLPSLRLRDGLTVMLVLVARRDPRLERAASSYYAHLRGWLIGHERARLATRAVLALITEDHEIRQVLRIAIGELLDQDPGAMQVLDHWLATGQPIDEPTHGPSVRERIVKDRWVRAPPTKRG